MQIIRGRKTSSLTEDAPVASSVPEEEGIFDVIVPDLAVDTARHSDFSVSLSDGLLGMDCDYGYGYHFMQNLPLAPLLEDNLESISFTEPLTPLFGWEPII